MKNKKVLNSVPFLERKCGINSSKFGIESGMSEGWGRGEGLANKILKETGERELMHEEDIFNSVVIGYNSNHF